MDDTQQSRVSDAAATRKRRSSILKSQRPARTPFSELEFNVATPTDTAKSRRVSFSRRTGVAEFITNEATTTWKNFYEEHNKSLESSGNDSVVNASRQPVEHLGKRIFDQQFEEVEAVDFMGSLNPTLGANSSLNNVNFTDQIASLECTGNIKLTAPSNHFELSALTDQQSKLFGNDFTVTGVAEMSGRIEVNFSTIQHIGQKDDLDDIERDLERGSNVVCVGPSSSHNMSEYIEVDLNMTHVAKNDDCDMSITDTVLSPKVQDVSKNCSIDKKVVVDKDWVTDKENIAINPYAAPRETDNFAVNEEPNQVLVFDGKRLTLQTEKPDKEYRKTLLPNTSAETPQRKTIVLNINDDLPNFVSDMSSKSEIDSKHSNLYNDFDFSLMSHVNKVGVDPKRKTIQDTTGNISITQALPSKIISGATDKRRTMVYGDEEANISMTQALPSKIISGPPERRHTMVYNEDEGNISITQALPSKIISDNADHRQTIIPADKDENISITQALPSNIISGADKRRTMLYDQDEANISMTQALPSNIISEVAEKRCTIVQDIDAEENISMTCALPSNIISSAADRRRTRVYDQDDANISMTQALPSNIISVATERRRTILYDDELESNISMTQVLPSKILSGANEHRTMVCDEEEMYISMTQALPSNIISGAAEKRLTMIYNDDAEGNISMTQVLPSNIIRGAAEKRRTMIYDDDEANISITQTLSAKMLSGGVEHHEIKVYNQEEARRSISPTFSVHIITENAKTSERRRTVLYENDSGNISITQMLPAGIIPSDDQDNTEKRKTIIFDDSNGNILVSKTVPVNKSLEQNPRKLKCNAFDDEGSMFRTQPVPVYVVLDTEFEEKRRTVIYEDTRGNISITEATPMSISPQKHEATEKRRTVVYQDDTGNISVIQALPPNIILGEVDSEEKSTEVATNITLKDCDTKRRTIVFENDTGNISVTQAISSQILPTYSSKSTVTSSEAISDKSSYTSSEEAVGTCRTTHDEITQDISAPQPIYANIIAPTENTSKDEIIVAKVDDCNKSIANRVPAVDFLLSGVESHSNVTLEDFKVEQTIKEDSEMSIVEPNPEVQTMTQESTQQTSKAINKDSINSSLSRPIPADLMSIKGDVLTKLVNKLDVMPVAINQDVLLYPSEIESKALKTEEESQNVEAPTEEIDASVASESKTEHIDIDAAQSFSEDLIKEDAGHVIESKVELFNLQANSGDEAMEVDNQLDIQSISLNDSEKGEPKPTVLETLLDLSELNLEPQAEKDAAISIQSLPQDEVKPEQARDSLFFITKEEDAVIQTDGIKSNETQIEQVEKASEPSLSVAITPVSEHSVVDTSMDLQKTITVLKSKKKHKSTSPVRKDVIIEEEVDRCFEIDGQKSPRKSFKNANDTKELLEMISDFTEKTRCEIEDEAPVKEIVAEKKMEPLRLSFAPNRQSIVFSREDLLNNISMAQAALQKSRIELEDSVADETQDTFTEEPLNVTSKADRLSSEVVKTLHFDDESISGCSMKSDASKHSPLRKTAFGETSYMKDSKANVIPPYLKDVTEDLKVLMSDLVKPMADVLPFDTTSDRKQSPQKTVSTISTQIQANLITSSQIDMDGDLCSNPQSTYDMDNVSSFCLRNHIMKEPSDSLKFTSESDVLTEMMESRRHQPGCAPELPAPGQVLIFDHLNPLNNVLIGPLDYMNVHSYNPGNEPISELPQKSEITLCGSEHSASCQVNGDVDSDMPQERVTIMYNVNTTVSPKVMRAKESPEKLQDDNENPPEDTKLDHQPADSSSDFKNAEMNTVIAMKENKELLNASSSLTLVDDALIDSEHGIPKVSKESKSPLRVIYKVEEVNGVTVMEKEESKSPNKDSSLLKNKKRNHTPTKLITSVLPNVDITPKPKSKIQKISNSPDVKFAIDLNQTTTKISAERDVEINQTRFEKFDGRPRRNVTRKSNDKAKTTFTVQRLITEYHVEAAINQSLLSKQVLEALKSDSSSVEPNSTSDVLECKSLEDVDSFTSSKNHHSIKGGESVSTNMSGLKSQSIAPSLQSSKSGWHPEETSLSCNPSEFDSGVNIVAKIDMLPFMGSHECEWESSAADTWCFRLLHGRIRLTVRLAHRHANAIKTRVRADTPVNDVIVETVQYEKKNPVSTLCVRFACETMRYMVSRARGEGAAAGAESSMLARAVPTLLRRCAAAARVALRWGRAMHEAKLQLAYTLDTNGYLTLKVANIPLRSVWEVSMRLELVVSGAAGAPWPRASDVRVARVVSDVRVPDADVRRALAHTPRDWGHAPRTIWRIFRYLKNKTRDDDLLLGV